MQDISFIHFLMFGIIAGICMSYFMTAARVRSEYDKARQERETEVSLLSEKLQTKEQALQELRFSLENAANETSAVRSDLQSQSEKRAAAEERNTRIPELEKNLEAQKNVIGTLQDENTKLKEQVSQIQTKLEEERKASEEKLAILNEAQKKLSDTFKALSSDALRSNNQSFLSLAKETLEKFQENARGDLKMRQQAIDELVKPLKTSLEKVDGKIQEIEKERTAAYSSLVEQVKSLATTQTKLQSETANLVNALRRPSVRGRWGEIQLKRVVEIAGMVPYCDFLEQESAATEEGTIRPDMLIKLPNNRNIVVDSKAPLQAYLDALEARDEGQKIDKLKQHARHIRNHLVQLSAKNYWNQFHPTPDFVVLFLPGETFFSAALEHDSGLIEYGVERRVILATPTTLIALLRAIAYGWRQEQIAQNAQEISELGKTLYERIANLADHISGVGKNLGKAVDSYNKAVGSFESRVMVSARKFKELGTHTLKDLDYVENIDKNVRQIQLPEMTEDNSSLT